MNNNTISVKLWGTEICKLEWRGGYKTRFGKIGAVVSFSKAYASTPWNLDPLGPYSTHYYFVREGLSDWCRATSDEGIPRFLSGSLPDDWGNTVFSAWMAQNNLHYTNVNTVHKLAFIGKRGMGALEYEPADEHPTAEDRLVLEQLYEAAQQVQLLRETKSINLDDNPGVNDLIVVGTSAGGMHPKAIISIDWETGDIRSGQIPLPASYKHYILKFKDVPAWPSAEIEYTYYKMASRSGIEMSPCRILSAGGENHFLVERFDRADGKKIHMATLYALAGTVSDYQDALSVCRRLNLPYADREQLFRRIVFNYLAGVCDDHDKNTSFLMFPDGTWRLSPAYDETFTVNLTNRFLADRHALSLNGKNQGVTREDLLAFGISNDIKDASLIIEDVADAVRSFSGLAEGLEIPAGIKGIIQDYIDRECGRGSLQS